MTHEERAQKVLAYWGFDPSVPFMQYLAAQFEEVEADGFTKHIDEYNAMVRPSIDAKDARIALLEAALERADVMVEELSHLGYKRVSEAYQTARSKVKP